MADERGKAIDLAVAQIEKQFGKGSIMRLGSKEAIVPISVIPTGSISFDGITLRIPLEITCDLLEQSGEQMMGSKIGFTVLRKSPLRSARVGTLATTLSAPSLRTFSTSAKKNVFPRRSGPPAPETAATGEICLC